MTSHDAVFKLRGILREKKIGHGGTLDPDVTGVLPIAVGKATRMIEYMQADGKTYEGEITIGYATTTEDASGDIVEKTPVVALSEEQVDQVMADMVGNLEQVPPLYSAVKVNGRKLYEYARAGKAVERPIRQVTLYAFERTSPIQLTDGCARFRFRVQCSKGTYVRTLSVDLGARLGYASHMSALERTRAGGLTIEDSLTLAEVADLVARNDWSFLLPIESGLGDLVQVVVDRPTSEEIRFGRFVSLEQQEEQLAALYQGRLLAILEKREHLYKPHKVFLIEENDEE